MSCNIKKGKYYDNNGNESKLYNDLVERVGEEQAHELFVLSHTPTFKSQNTQDEESTAQEVLLYAENNFALTEPLTSEEKLDLSTLQLEDVETSEDLYDVLSDAFYKDNVFSPQIKKLKKIYSETEIRNILEDVEIQARIKETIEKLRFTEPFNITQVEKNKDYGYKELSVNIIGQYKAGLDKPQEGVEVDVIDESEEVVENKLIYDNAVRQVDDPKIIDAIEAVISAPQAVQTYKVQNKVVNWLKNYGLDITNLSRENYSILRDFIANPTDENTIQLEKSLGFERSPKKEIIKIETSLDRSYKYLRTIKSEQQLFDKYSLIKTNTPNVYHQINKLDEEQMRTLMKNKDLSVPIYELYKEYFGYGFAFETQRIKEKSITDGTFMKTSNGKKTNLSEENWLFVRTETFKEWSNNSTNILLDENDEPKVYYHSSKVGGITEFTMSPSDDDFSKGGFFITPKQGWDFLKTGIEYQLFVGYNKDEIFDIENENNIQEFAYKVYNDYKDILGKIDYSNIIDIILPNSNITFYTIFKQKYTKQIKEQSKKYKEKELYDEIGEFYGTISKEESYLEYLETYFDKTNELSLVLNTLSTINRRHSLYKDYLSIERNGGIIEKLGFKGAYIFESKIKNIHLYNTNRVNSAENIRTQTDKESNDIRYFKRASKPQKINTNIQTDINYLTEEFVADFAKEKIKNPNSINKLFKITDAGIELVSNDELTMAKVLSQVEDYPALQDYSLISKSLPNLKSAQKTVETKEDRRIQAVNNKESVSTPKTEIEIVDDNLIKAENETAEFLRVGNDVYEMQESGIYSKLKFQENPNYYTFEVNSPEYRTFDNRLENSTEVKSKKLTDKETDNDNFSCL